MDHLTQNLYDQGDESAPEEIQIADDKIQESLDEWLR